MKQLKKVMKKKTDIKNNPKTEIKKEDQKKKK